MNNAKAANDQMTFDDIKAKLTAYYDIVIRPDGDRYWNKNQDMRTLKEQVRNGNYLECTDIKSCNHSYSCASNSFGGLNFSNDASQCAGFAVYLEYVIWGDALPTYDECETTYDGYVLKGWTIHKSVESNFEFMPGDLIRRKSNDGNSKHSLVVWYTDGDTVRLIDGNGDYKCGIGARTETATSLRDAINAGGYVWRSPAISCTHPTWTDAGKCSGCGADYYTDYWLKRSEVRNGTLSTKDHEKMYNAYLWPVWSEAAKSGKTFTGDYIQAVREGKNHEENSWYEFRLAGDETPYFTSADNVTFTPTATANRITFSGALPPSSIEQGNAVTVNGTITSTINDLTRVEIGIYPSGGSSPTYYVNHTGLTGKQYVLTSADSSAMKFQLLNAGNYYFMLRAWDGAGITSDEIPAEHCLQVRKEFTVDVDESDFSYTVANGKATITGYSGDATSLTIPRTLGGYPVTSIGDSAFSSNQYLRSITIPNSVTAIEAYAFYQCSRLASITISNNATSIGEGAFVACTSLTSITIPNSVTSIGERAFVGCTGLTSITIPSSMTTIGNQAFSGCSGLTNIAISSGVTSIENNAFYLCTNLTSITMPNSVTSIGRNAFGECTNLTSITIPKSVTSIGIYAFYQCSKLSQANFSGNAPTSFDDEVFDNCAPDFAIYYDPSTTGWTTPTWNGYKCYPVGNVPIVIVGPTDQTARAGETATFSITDANGNPPPCVFQWEISRDAGATWSHIGGNHASHTTSTLSLGNNGFQYRCIVQNGNNTETTGAATLTVTNADGTDSNVRWMSGTNQLNAVNNPSQPFRCNGSFSDFQSVYVDGEFVSSDQYLYEEGSTVVTLKAEYLSTLSLGRHMLSLTFSGATSNGVATTTFVLGESASVPATGDSSALLLWGGLAIVSGVGLALLRKKRRHT